MNAHNFVKREVASLLAVRPTPDPLRVVLAGSRGGSNFDLVSEAMSALKQSADIEFAATGACGMTAGDSRLKGHGMRYGAPPPREAERFQMRSKAYQLLTAPHWAMKGYDRLATKWCEENGVLCYAEPADWDNLGKRGGPVRNDLMMLKFEPHIVVLFPGGPGTADCGRKARDRGVGCIINLGEFG